MLSLPGVVIVPTGEAPRYNAFLASLFRLSHHGLPEGSAIFWHQGVDVPYLLNHGIRRMLADPRMAWAWVIGDDHTFEPDIVMRLLDRDVDVVAPLVLRRAMPHRTVAYGTDGEVVAFGPEARGLQRVHAAGNAGMLIRRGVFDVTDAPWFEHHGRERAGEDLAFCAKLRAAGIPIYVDVDVHMGHITPVEVWPTRTDQGAWNVKYKNHLTMEVL